VVSAALGTRAYSLSYCNNFFVFHSSTVVHGAETQFAVYQHYGQQVLQIDVGHIAVVYDHATFRYMNNQAHHIFCSQVVFVD
jgi:hypothetical protein